MLLGGSIIFALDCGRCFSWLPSTTNVLRHINRPFVRTCCCSFYVATTCEHGYTTTRLHGYSVLHATSVGVTIVAVHGGLQLFLACPFVRVLQLRHTRTIAR